MAGLLYLSLTSISVAHFIFQKDIANITQTAIGFFALYALARLRRIAVQYKEKYINELSDTLETSRALMHKTHLLSDLLDHNRSALQGYKKQWYNIIEETAPRSYIDINSYKSQDETTDQLTKTIFVSKAVSEPIPERIISNIYSVLGIATQPNKRYEATH